MAAWRHLATSPKDGTMVVLLLAGSSDDPDAERQRVEFARYADNRWVDACNYSAFDGKENKPIRWLPIPPLPPVLP